MDKDEPKNAGGAPEASGREILNKSVVPAVQTTAAELTVGNTPLAQNANPMDNDFDSLSERASKILSKNTAGAPEEVLSREILNKSVGPTVKTTSAALTAGDISSASIRPQYSMHELENGLSVQNEADAPTAGNESKKGRSTSDEAANPNRQVKPSVLTNNFAPDQHKFAFHLEAPRMEPPGLTKNGLSVPLPNEGDDDRNQSHNPEEARKSLEKIRKTARILESTAKTKFSLQIGATSYGQSKKRMKMSDKSERITIIMPDPQGSLDSEPRGTNTATPHKNRPLGRPTRTNK